MAACTVLKTMGHFLRVSLKVTPVLTAKQKFPEYFEKHLQHLFIYSTIYSGTPNDVQRNRCW